MKKLIKQLKRTDRFLFNGVLFDVTRCWVSDTKPMYAINQTTQQKEQFFNPDLEIIKPL
jgi:hypothetical protein